MAAAFVGPDGVAIRMPVELEPNPLIMAAVITNAHLL